MARSQVDKSKVAAERVDHAWAVTRTEVTRTGKKKKAVCFTRDVAREAPEACLYEIGGCSYRRVLRIMT